VGRARIKRWGRSMPRGDGLLYIPSMGRYSVELFSLRSLTIAHDCGNRKGGQVTMPASSGAFAIHPMRTTYEYNYKMYKRSLSVIADCNPFSFFLRFGKFFPSQAQHADNVVRLSF